MDIDILVCHHETKKTTKRKYHGVVNNQIGTGAFYTMYQSSGLYMHLMRLS